MMQLIDKRGKVLDKTFNDLACGECYQDGGDSIYMKIGWDRAMVWDGTHWVPHSCIVLDELIIPLKTTITVEREDG